MHLTISGKQWTAFLLQNIDILQRIPAAEFHLTVSESQHRSLREAQLFPMAAADPKAACETLYVQELARNTTLINGRNLAWAFLDLTDRGEFGDGYINWTIELFLR